MWRVMLATILLFSLLTSAASAEHGGCYYTGSFGAVANWWLSLFGGGTAGAAGKGCT